MDDLGRDMPRQSRSEAMLAWMFAHERNKQRFVRHSVKSILEAK